MEKIYYIYKITNTINGKSYIGFTSNPKRRWWYHQKMSKSPKYLFHKAIAKYNWENFTKEIIVCSKDKDYCLNVVLEPMFIEEYKSLTEGYNMTRGGEHTEPTEKIKKKISEAKKGVPVPEERRKRIAETLKGNIPWNKGKINIYSEETLESNRQKHLGRKHSEETIQKMRNSSQHKSRAFTEETRKKLSEAQKGKTQSARIWHFIDPNGNPVEIYNLSEFCRENKLLRRYMSDVAQGKLPQYKRWTSL